MKFFKILRVFLRMKLREIIDYFKQWWGYLGLSIGVFIGYKYDLSATVIIMLICIIMICTIWIIIDNWIAATHEAKSQEETK